MFANRPSFTKLANTSTSLDHVFYDFLFYRMLRFATAVVLVLCLMGIAQAGNKDCESRHGCVMSEPGSRPKCTYRDCCKCKSK